MTDTPDVDLVADLKELAENFWHWYEHTDEPLNDSHKVAGSPATIIRDAVDALVAEREKVADFRFKMVEESDAATEYARQLAESTENLRAAEAWVAHLERVIQKTSRWLLSRDKAVQVMTAHVIARTLDAALSPEESV